MVSPYEEEIPCPMCGARVTVTARKPDHQRQVFGHETPERVSCWVAGFSVTEARSMAAMQAERGFALRAHP